MLKGIYNMTTEWAIASKNEILKNRLLGYTTNLVYPLYCRVKHIKKVVKVNNHSNIIVSLTSFPPRIDKLNLCIESILRQTRPADKVILWLAKSQFKSKNELPLKLTELEKFGLTIEFCDDIKSYKKIVYTAKYYSDNIIITADDDTLYPENWIENLMKTYEQHKDCVVCYRAHEMTFNNKKQLLPYNKWNGLSPDFKGPSHLLVPIGVGGVLYPPNFFKNVDFNNEVIMKICPTTDDLWLKAIGLIKGKKVVKVNKNSKEWFTVKSTQKVALVNENVNDSSISKNDKAMKNLMDYYNIDLRKFL